MNPCKFAIVSNKSDENSYLMKELRDQLISRGFIEDKNPELILAIGGDGSLMRAIQHYGREGKYLLINSGHLGFYSDYASEEYPLFLRDLFEKEGEIELLPCYSFIENGKEHFFVNDVAIQSGETCFMKLYVNGELLTESRNNGIVVSTPMGTTGYLTSLGSPVVIHNPDIYQYALIAPCFNRMFTNTISKAILRGEDELKVDILHGEGDIYIDGGRKTPIKGKEFKFFHRKNEFIKMLRLRKTSSVIRLRENVSGKDVL